MGVLIFLAAVVCSLRIRLVAQRQKGGALWVWLRLGPFRFQLIPPPEKEEKRTPAPPPVPEAAEREAADAAADPAALSLPPPEPDAPPVKKKRRFPPVDLQTVKQLLHTFGPPLKKALRRLGRGITLDPLEGLAVLGGAADPAAAAVRCGNLQGVLWGLMPQVQRHIRIPRPHLGIRVDFTQEETEVYGRAGISVRVGTLAGIAVSLAVPVLGWLRAQKKRAAAGKEEEHGKEQSPA